MLVKNTKIMNNNHFYNAKNKVFKCACIEFNYLVRKWLNGTQNLIEKKVVEKEAL